MRYSIRSLFLVTIAVAIGFALYHRRQRAWEPRCVRVQTSRTRHYRFPDTINGYYGQWQYNVEHTNRGMWLIVYRDRERGYSYGDWIGCYLTNHRPLDIREISKDDIESQNGGGPTFISSIFVRHVLFGGKRDYDNAFDGWWDEYESSIRWD